MPLEPPVRALLEARNFAHVATIRKDGTPHVVPVWCDTDGEHVVVNTADGRSWANHLERDPRATITVTNMENPYEYVTMRAEVGERTHDGADDLIDQLAKKYLGVDEYPYRQPDEQRVTIRFKPSQIHHRH